LSGVSVINLWSRRFGFQQVVLLLALISDIVYKFVRNFILMTEVKWPDDEV
jgi:hypothetical protein